MADDLHTISITGRLGRDADLRAAGDQSVLELNVAVNHRQKVGGQWTDVATWYRCQVWGKRAESLHKLGLTKGSRVAVTGMHEPREYQDKGGQKRISEEINNAQIYLMGSKQDGQGARPQHTSGPADDYFPPDGTGADDAYQDQF